ncbi:MAG: hypothetical protein NTZ50_01515, partial [Chloroflexi bacterium]|nr:hypothetical protein [Chloroflexota bacterium]
HCERGDGETASFIASTPVLFGLLAFGITVAALGFGRIGAAAAAERGAYAAGTKIEGVQSGPAVTLRFLGGWASASGAAAGTDVGEKSVRVTVERSATYGGAWLGRYVAEQTGAMRKRIERFYPGGGE